MRAADEHAGLLALELATRPEPELMRLFEGISEILERPEKQSVVINVQVSLDDQQSRQYEIIKLISGIDEAKGSVKTLVYDGIVLENYVLLSALYAALALKGFKFDDGGQEDK